MTNDQKNALEALVGRPLSEAEIGQIDNWLVDRRDDQIASILSAGRTKVVSHFASERGILERYPHGPLEADALLAKLEAFAQAGHPLSRLVGRAVKFLGQPEGLDIGSATTQMMVAQLTGAEVLTSREQLGLRAMATVADPISVARVSDALNVAEGRMTL